jgi:hypothetical protein
MKAYLWESSPIIGMAVGIGRTEEEAQQYCIKHIENENFIDSQKQYLIKELKLLFKITPKIYGLPFGIVTWGEDCKLINWRIK